MDVTTERIKKLLGHGLKPEIVASSVGVSSSYISQLLNDENFFAEVSTLRATNVEENIKRDQRYDKLENTILDKIDQFIGLVHKPLELCSILRTVNQAVRRAEPQIGMSESPKQAVVLDLPPQIRINLVVNNANQVVEVDKRSLVTISAKRLIESIDENSPKAKQAIAAIQNSSLLSDKIARSG
jgi:transcriptional regulator with XRE-family HTH domain